MTRIAIEITIDISDLTTTDEADEIRNLIEDAVSGWKPTITVTSREYEA